MLVKGFLVRLYRACHATNKELMVGMERGSPVMLVKLSRSALVVLVTLGSSKLGQSGCCPAGNQGAHAQRLSVASTTHHRFHFSLAVLSVGKVNIFPVNTIMLLLVC